MGGAELTVLVIGGDSASTDAAGEAVRARGYLSRPVASAEQGIHLHRDEGADLIVLLLPFADGDSAGVMARLRAQDPRVAVVIAGRDAHVHGRSEALDLGAAEYTPDPRNHADLLLVVAIAVAARHADAQLRWLRNKEAANASWQSLVGECPEMRQVFATVRHLCHRTASGGTPAILITGETGTGKGQLAKAIHYNSIRRSRALVDVNCSAIPPTLIEAELFGHERGAFTDARTARPGLFELADGGTLFLDEIGSLPLDMQAKLLTAIEEKTIRRIGGQRSISVDVQVIAATHRDVASMVRTGAMRADLFHRLNVLAIHLPPLRERGADKVLLAEAFVLDMCRSYGIEQRRLSPSGMRAIERYSWPGNVRELRNQLERTILLHDGAEITAQQLRLGAEGTAPLRIDHADGSGGALEVTLPDRGFSLDELEREVLRQALVKHAGNVSATARYLGISRHTLIYRIRKHALENAT
jgi:two-component system, NtrC family, response regulator AtoC